MAAVSRLKHVLFHGCCCIHLTDVGIRLNYQVWVIFVQGPPELPHLLSHAL